MSNKPDLMPYGHQSVESSGDRENYRLQSAAVYNKIVDAVNNNPVGKNGNTGKYDNFSQVSVVQDEGHISEAILSSIDDPNKPKTKITLDKDGLLEIKQSVLVISENGLKTIVDLTTSVDGTTVDVKYQDTVKAFNADAPKRSHYSYEKFAKVTPTGKEDLSLKIVYGPQPFSELQSVSLIGTNNEAISLNSSIDNPDFIAGNIRYVPKYAKGCTLTLKTVPMEEHEGLGWHDQPIPPIGIPRSGITSHQIENMTIDLNDFLKPLTNDKY